MDAVHPLLVLGFNYMITRQEMTDTWELPLDQWVYVHDVGDIQGLHNCQFYLSSSFHRRHNVEHLMKEMAERKFVQLTEAELLDLIKEAN